MIEIRDKYFPNGYVYFSKITDWQTYSKEDFEKRAVWKPTHPNYNEFIKVFKENVPEDISANKIGTNLKELF